MKWMNIKISDEELTSGYLVEIINTIKSLYPLGGLTKPVAIYMEVTRSQVGWTNFYVSPTISAVIQLKLKKDEVCYCLLSYPPDLKDLMHIFGRNVLYYNTK
ncbi:hypothetical protein AAFX24_27400 [Vibrio mediterranei]|uniref:hypothetical protein n=1 Tax=Vibrio mediterranei TaxID=689 RepID=UPI0038CE09F1